MHLFENQRYLKWFNLFEFHKRIHVKNQKINAIVKQKFNDKFHTQIT